MNVSVLNRHLVEMQHDFDMPSVGARRSLAPTWVPNISTLIPGGIDCNKKTAPQKKN
jgi:hypothetical protein